MHFLTNFVVPLLAIGAGFGVAICTRSSLRLMAVQGLVPTITAAGLAIASLAYLAGHYPDSFAVMAFFGVCAWGWCAALFLDGDAKAKAAKARLVQG